MSQLPITELPTDQLIKRKRFSGFVLGLVWTLASIAILLAIYVYIRDSEMPSTAFISGTTCFVISIPMYIGRKKIIEELDKREAKGE